MTCESALELLLVAEPSEFSANERTPLGEHLRGCVRCRRVGTQLMQDTRQLAVAMASAPVLRPARRAVRVTFAPVLAVAALLLVVVLRARPEASIPVPSVAERVPSAPVAPPPATPNVDAAPRRVSVSRPAALRAFARAVPLAPVRLVPAAVSETPLSVETGGVSVTPPVGTRATVMHTSNPKLVVVWLH